MTLSSLIRRVRRAFRRQEPLITVSISQEHLRANLRAYQERYPNQAIAPVLKSNAYGHGLSLVARILDAEDIAFLMVDSLFEARKLRRDGIRTKIVVMGYVRPEQIAQCRLRDIEFAMTDIEQLRTLSAISVQPTALHLKIDTGMHRQGLLPQELDAAVAYLSANPLLCVTGIATHLADADSEDEGMTKKQLSIWRASVAHLDAAFPTIRYRHAAATKGARWSAAYPMNVVRVGMGLYGCDTSAASDLPLLPVLSMRSSIVSIREIPEGESVGYNGIFVAACPSRIATIPAGYYEGIDRALSGKGSFLVRGKIAPLAGRVSMNMSSIDITDIPEAARGDAVTLISREPGDPNSVRALATLADTTPYVLLAHIPEHLYRVVE
ncbi:MAG TPA: alanine racemase [Candidatus Paceibacterota bacterium]